MPRLQGRDAVTDITMLMNEHIRNLVPYSSARDEFQGDADIFLDANESWRGGNDGINRYPDPVASRLRRKLEEVLSLPFACTAVGNGSDEIIDMLIRIFCSPSDSVMIERPTYGAYKVFADISNIPVVDVPLGQDLYLDKAGMIRAIRDRKPKLVFICSPNNPTGIVYSLKDIAEIAEMNEGITVIDEAYADFAEGFESALSLIAGNPRVVVLRTLSKAWGIAGARIGILVADERIISAFVKAKAPYNVSRLSQDMAIHALEDRKAVEDVISGIRAARKAFEKEAAGYPFVREVIPSQANFSLIRVDDADRLWKYLIGKGIVVRNRTKEPLLSGCIRITIGSEEENRALMEALSEYR